MTKAYFCDICGERFDTEELADKCEENCKAEKLKRENLAKEKESRISEINLLVANLEGEIKKFRNDYGEYPPVNIVVSKSAMFPFSFSYLFR